MSVPFINKGGAAFTDMRCVGVQGRSKVKDGKWSQTYTLTFKACAGPDLQDVLQTACGSLKSAPLNDLDMRLGFYPVEGETFTVPATVAVSILDVLPVQIQLVAKFERVKDKDGNFNMTLDVFSPWLEQQGVVILRPRFCDDTVDMFEDGIIPPLTIHKPDSAPVETTLTGAALMLALTTNWSELRTALSVAHALDDDDSVSDFIGSADGGGDE